MQDGTKREVVSWKLSAAFFWCFLNFSVFVCNMLLQNACKHHQTYVRKSDEHGPKMVPKPLQNRSWRGSGGLLVATLETRCFQDLIFDDFGSILGQIPLVFLAYVWCFLHAFVSNMLQKETFEITRISSQECNRELPRNTFSLRAILHWKVH